ncbi:MAG: TGS domain-containing protein [Porphyromonas sp.]|nr:TGS domain-containing protein [Porphyromonas sp.]
MKQYKDLDRLESLDYLVGLLQHSSPDMPDAEWAELISILEEYHTKVSGRRDSFGLPMLTRKLLSAITISGDMGIGGATLQAVLLQLPLDEGMITEETVKEKFGSDTWHLLTILDRVADLYSKNAVVTSENFSHFLLSFVEDVRVIFILIADRLEQLRLAGRCLSEDRQMELSVEVSFLFAPLAHRLGLYGIKGEMEDLCLKYTDRETYSFIKAKLAATKRARDAYIAKFIAPVKKALEEEGLKFSIKGRTKSISSIRNKLIKQKIEFESIYDLFAIRVILDTPLELEKSQCWKVYSVITDMFQPNPKRLKDFISVPKSNGYESLHITVMGPENKWVEVQIRTERMDEIAEKGLAAHWRYKGVKSDTGLDDFMTNVRMALENKSATSEEVMDEFRMNLFDEEIYVFTPKGDLVKLPKGASVLDFAYAIHSGLGAKTVSALVNGSNAGIRQLLHNGDTVAINTSNSQTPKADWLQFVVTSKARSKIKQALRVESEKAMAMTKEEMKRRMKNRKLEFDESLFTKLIRRKEYKTTSDFYKAVYVGHIDLNAFLDEYKTESDLFLKQQSGQETKVSADQYISTTLPELLAEETDDILTIDNNLSGVDYQLAKCCNPIYGDPIFAFVSRAGIKIHRKDCPNAVDMFTRFGYRILKARWKGSGNEGDEVVLKVIGHDDLNVVHAIMSKVSGDGAVILRSYNIQSGDGLFQAHFHLFVKKSTAINPLVKSLREVSGVKNVERVR